MARLKMERKAEVVFSREAYFRMMEYCRQAKGEVTGFGSVTEREGYLYVDEVYIMPQFADAAGVVVNQKTMLELMSWARAQGRPDLVPKARLWWHSHAKFDVFRSKTDNDTIELLLSMMPYVVAVVGNHAGEYECSVHHAAPRTSVTNLRIYQEDYDPLKIAQEIQQEIAEKVHEFVVPEPLKEAPAFAHSEERPVSYDKWDRYRQDKQAELELIMDPTELRKAPKSLHEMSEDEWQEFLRANGG